MAQNKVQYQRGLSMPEFFDGYGSAEQCEALVRSWRWPGGFVCARCQGFGRLVLSQWSRPAVSTTHAP